jgi:hypothetical protein
MLDAVAFYFKKSKYSRCNNSHLTSTTTTFNNNHNNNNNKVVATTRAKCKRRVTGRPTC